MLVSALRSRHCGHVALQVCTLSDEQGDKVKFLSIKCMMSPVHVAARWPRSWGQRPSPLLTKGAVKAMWATESFATHPTRSWPLCHSRYKMSAHCVHIIRRAHVTYPYWQASTLPCTVQHGSMPNFDMPHLCSYREQHSATGHGSC